MVRNDWGGRDALDGSVEWDKDIDLAVEVNFNRVKFNAIPNGRLPLTGFKDAGTLVKLKRKAYGNGSGRRDYAVFKWKPPGSAEEAKEYNNGSDLIKAVVAQEYVDLGMAPSGAKAIAAATKLKDGAMYALRLGALDPYNQCTIRELAKQMASEGPGLAQLAEELDTGKQRQLEEEQLDAEGAPLAAEEEEEVLDRSMARKQCQTPGCTLEDFHTGAHSFEIAIGKRKRVCPPSYLLPPPPPALAEHREPAKVGCKQCKTPSCTFSVFHKGAHSFEIVLGKRQRVCPPSSLPPPPPPPPAEHREPAKHYNSVSKPGHRAIVVDLAKATPGLIVYLEGPLGDATIEFLRRGVAKERLVPVNWHAQACADCEARTGVPCQKGDIVAVASKIESAVAVLWCDMTGTTVDISAVARVAAYLVVTLNTRGSTQDRTLIAMERETKRAGLKTMSLEKYRGVGGVMNMANGVFQREELARWIPPKDQHGVDPWSLVDTIVPVPLSRWEDAHIPFDHGQYDVRDGCLDAMVRRVTVDCRLDLEYRTISGRFEPDQHRVEDRMPPVTAELVASWNREAAEKRSNREAAEKRSIEKAAAKLFGLYLYQSQCATKAEWGADEQMERREKKSVAVFKENDTMALHAAPLMASRTLIERPTSERHDARLHPETTETVCTHLSTYFLPASSSG